jgi:hypothetical protein
MASTQRAVDAAENDRLESVDAVVETAVLAEKPVDGRLVIALEEHFGEWTPGFVEQLRQTNPTVPDFYHTLRRFKLSEAQAEELCALWRERRVA